MDAERPRVLAPLPLFYSYAEKDEELREELEKHLSILQRQRTIAGWHHHKILPGTDKHQINDEQFSSAQIIILLISPDFLASDASHSEMERALQRHRAGLAYVIPLLLRPVDWRPAPFAHLQVLPRNGIPVTKWDNLDEAFADIAKDVRHAIKQWNDPSLQQLPQSIISGPPYPFLSFARKDLSLVNSLKDDLQAYGRMGEIDISGKNEKEDLREVIRNASVVILVATPHARRSRSVKQELYIAEMYQRPVYLFWMQGNHLMEVVPTGWSHLPSIDARGERYPQALQDLVQALGRQTSFSTPQVSLSERPASPPRTPRNPYKGLRAFSTEDAQDFFGRDRLIQELLEKVKQLLPMGQRPQAASRLLTILGPSGSGKSSVVMAGLIPKLKQGMLPRSERWVYLPPMAPGKHPIEALASTLAPLFPQRSPIKIMHEDLEDDSARGLHVLLTTYVKSSSVSVLLVIDQFEELFTQTATEDERRHFLDLLLTAVTEPSGPLITVITLRADFYDRPLQYPELGHLVEAQHLTVYPLEMRDLRAVIEQPAQLPDVQLVFEEDLVGDLLFEMHNQVGALPLLQFALDQLVQQRRGHLLTRHACQEMGGVQGALAKHAEHTYQSLSTPSHQRLARALFLRLMNLGTMEQDVTKRRISFTELVVTDPKETAQLAEVATAFTKARLLTTNTIDRISTIEVSHEAVLRAWTRLGKWFNEAREDIRVQQAVSEDAANWQRHGQPPDWLYHGSQLEEALQWRVTNLPSRDEELFLQASIEEQRRRQQRERRQRQGYTRRTIVLAATTGFVGITGTGLFVDMLWGNSSSSGLITPVPVSRPLPYSYTLHTGVVESVAWSHDGRHIASADDGHVVQVWDPATGNTLLTYTKHSDFVVSVAWSPDNRHIASAGGDKTVQIWDSITGKTLFTYTKHFAAVGQIAWSSDSRHIASASGDKTVQIWDSITGDTLLTYTKHSAAVWRVAWSPNSKRIASAGDEHIVQVWDSTTGKTLLTYTKHSDFVVRVVWSPDGRRIASAGRDTTVQVWDSVTGNTLLIYTKHSATVQGVAWSPDGMHIASAGGDKTVQVWDSTTGKLLLIYTRHTTPVEDVVWSPDGRHIASAGDDHAVQIWNPTTGTILLTYTKHSATVSCVAWSPDGMHIVSVGGDGTAQVWDSVTGNTLLTYTKHTNYVLSVVWSPDGRRIASASGDQTVRVWDSTTGDLLLTYLKHTDQVWSVSWSPDGRRIASAGWDGTAQVWDSTTGKILLTYTKHSGYVNCVAWSPDGMRIASAGDDTTVQVWDSTTGKTLLTYAKHTNHIGSVAWSPDGKYIASAGDDTTVQIWDSNTGNTLLTYTKHSAFVRSVSWSPDGRRIASAGRDRTVQVWNPTTGNTFFTYTEHSAIVWSAAWSPDGMRIASAGDDTTVQVWCILPAE